MFLIPIVHLSQCERVIAKTDKHLEGIPVVPNDDDELDTVDHPRQRTITVGGLRDRVALLAHQLLELRHVHAADEGIGLRLGNACRTEEHKNETQNDVPVFHVDLSGMATEDHCGELFPLQDVELVLFPIEDLLGLLGEESSIFVFREHPKISPESADL